MRSLCVVALVLTGVVVGGCGGAGQHPQPAPGSPQRPLVATVAQHDAAESDVAQPADEGTRATGNAAAPKPTARPQPTARPRSARHGTPCDLVSAARAAQILGPVQRPLLAPQGPTCIYRSSDGKRFVTLAVQSYRFALIRRHVQARHQVAVGRRVAYCGRYGQPVLYLPLQGARTLTVTAPCAVARAFAATAVRRLAG